MENNFLQFISDLRAAVSRTDDLRPAFTLEDSRQVLESIKEIAFQVSEEIERCFPNQIISDEEKEAVLGLEELLRRLRGEEKIRLAALIQFDAMSGASANAAI